MSSPKGITSTIEQVKQIRAIVLTVSLFHSRVGNKPKVLSHVPNSRETVVDERKKAIVPA